MREENHDTFAAHNEETAASEFEDQPTIQERAVRLRAEMERLRGQQGGEATPDRRKAPYWPEWWNYWANG